MENENDNLTRAELYRSPAREVMHWIWRFFRWVFLLIAILIATGIGVFAYYAKDAPVITMEQMKQTGDSTFYDRSGNKLMSLGTTKHVYASEEEIPYAMKMAVTSIEDRRFYQNPLGIDPIRIAKSFVEDVRSRDSVAGGSTITQQLVKLSVFSTSKSQQTLRRKAQEAWLAIKLTNSYSKDKIMALYLNKVYMNYGCYGVQTAAQYYYGKKLKDLDLPQIAMLAGMLNAPTSFDPYLHPKAAVQRRNLVLYTMYQQGYIKASDYESACSAAASHGLVKTHGSDQEVQAKIWQLDDPYFKEAIDQLTEAGYNPYTQHMKIYLNIDQDVQKKLYDLVNGGEISFTSAKMQIGSTVTDPTNGRVLAVIGGRNLDPNVRLGYNRSDQTSRSSGSTIKPLLDYAPAIEKLHWSTEHTVDDTSYVYPGTNIVLNDYDYAHLGYISMRYALEQSRNIPAVRALQAVGMKHGSDFVKQMDIKVPTSQGLSAGIGAYASPTQLAGAYGALANYGVYYKPSFVSSAVLEDGQKVDFDSAPKRVMKLSTAYMITDMLKGVITRGSGTAAKAGSLYEAGKTGTVQYSKEELAQYPSYKNTPKDSWFVGYTRYFVISSWVGYDKLADGTIDEKVGTYAPQKLYKSLITYLMQDKKNTDWVKPTSVYKYGTALSPVSASKSPDKALLERYKQSPSKAKAATRSPSAARVGQTITTTTTHQDGSKTIVQRTYNADGSITTKTTNISAAN